MSKIEELLHEFGKASFQGTNKEILQKKQKLIERDRKLIEALRLVVQNDIDGQYYGHSIRAAREVLKELGEDV